MSIWVADQRQYTLTAELLNNEVLAFVDDSTDFIQITSPYYEVTIPIIAQIWDGGVTQAEPELVTLSHRATTTSISIRRRGMFSTSIPASWPVGSTITIVNHAEILNAASAFYNGYVYVSAGWVAAAASNPLSSRLKFHGGASPAAATHMAIDDQPDNHWDLGNLIGLLAAGDLVRLKYIWYGANIALTSVGATDVIYHPTARIEFKIGAGGPVDNTGWWSIPIDATHYYRHSDLPDTDAGTQGLVVLDFMKLV